jgi:hypothetical protein
MVVTMVTLRIIMFWTLSIVRYFRDYKTQRFRNGICFRLQVRGRRNLLWSTEWRKGPNRVGVFLLHLKMEIGPVSKMLSVLVSRTLDDGQSPKRIQQICTTLYVLHAQRMHMPHCNLYQHCHLEQQMLLVHALHVPPRIIFIGSVMLLSLTPWNYFIAKVTEVFV